MSKDGDLATIGGKMGTKQDSSVRVSPLLIIGLSGLAGILVDIDHPLAIWLGIADKRFLHPYLLIASLIVLCGIGAYLGRLLHRMVLNDKNIG